jgi:hypothetical protein
MASTAAAFTSRGDRHTVSTMATEGDAAPRYLISNGPVRE